MLPKTHRTTRPFGLWKRKSRASCGKKVFTATKEYKNVVAAVVVAVVVVVDSYYSCC